MPCFAHPAMPRWTPVPTGAGALQGAAAAAAEEVVARLRGAEIFGQFKAAFELIADLDLRLAVPGNREVARCGAARQCVLRAVGRGVGDGGAVPRLARCDARGGRPVDAHAPVFRRSGRIGGAGAGG